MHLVKLLPLGMNEFYSASLSQYDCLVVLSALLWIHRSLKKLDLKSQFRFLLGYKEVEINENKTSVLVDFPAFQVISSSPQIIVVLRKYSNLWSVVGCRRSMFIMLNTRLRMFQKQII